MAEHQGLQFENRALPEIPFVGAGRGVHADAVPRCVYKLIAAGEMIARRVCMKSHMFRVLPLGQASDCQLGG
jgi:hypothetical protein